MRNIFMLSFANIRKSKGNSVLLFLMFLISGLLMNAGLLVFLDFGNYFNKLSGELNSSTAYYIISSDIYNDQVENYILNDENVIDIQKEDAIWFYGEEKYQGEIRSDIFMLLDSEYSRDMSKWKFVGEHLPSDENSVYLPYRYNLVSGYQLNDKFAVTIKDQELTFTVKGFIEDVFYSSVETGVVGLYLSHEAYQAAQNQLDDVYNTTLVFANLNEYNKDLELGIRELTNADNVLTSFTSVNQGKSMFSFDLGIIKLARTMMATMVALMIVAFAIIIVAVCLIVIRFRISNSIEDDMTKIGSLKAIGYTSKQIISSIVLQFLMIAFIGSLVGVGLSYLTTGALSDVFAQQSGLKWEQTVNVTIGIFSLIFTILIVVIASYFASKRIKKLHPIVALRGGIITHSFRKNYLPLSSTIGNLPVVLALKSIFLNLKQSFMMIIILISVSFAGTFAVGMYYNTNIDTTTFMETPGVELSDIIVSLDTEKDNTTIINQIKQMSEVRKVQYIDQLSVKIKDSDVIAFVMDDYSQKETNSIYKGRYPIHSNEIAIAGYLSNLYKKTIGDTITVKYMNTEKEFLITGLTQGAYMQGVNISITTESALLLNPTFEQQSLQIYLGKDVNTETIVNEFEVQYGGEVISIINAEKNMENGASSYISIVSKVGEVILVVTFAVVILVLYFVINSSVIRRKRELGIQKAIGFTTLQLMNQFTLGFLLPIVVGVVIGSILGFVGTNPMMSVVQRAMGIMKANYIMNPLWVTIFGVIIAIISYVTSMLLTYRIRKISPYSLVTE